MRISNFYYKVSPFWLHLFAKAGRGMILFNLMILKRSIDVSSQTNSPNTLRTHGNLALKRGKAYGWG